ncbi:hypothetical protein Bhyg_10906 [Pseudolycoriella hygida]|uniref:LisH domain-containing protein n=1 Tax=Pseudolycoriella hygida TaxID=35572 RepID=A0A9Q0RZP2_9DIPT|nr:hypothetical protein Bhyg_10906 [Pseudolycoriella hygida]
MAHQVDLDEIKNIPEDEFKRNLFDWVEQMDISKELQSKLRSDLFQNFGKTALGRQIAAQYQQSQRMVLSPLILVINTLVAEFLYAQNCHFTLSVFSSEVPYKNALPDFEKINKFRFDSTELEEIMKALSLDRSDIYKSEICQSYKTPHKDEGACIDKSLLFCIIKTLSQAVSTDRIHETDAVPQRPPNEEQNCENCKTNCSRIKNDELHSKYYKHFYKYLELLSQHVVEISENTKKINEPTQPNDQASKNSLRTCELNKRLDKITESLKNLSKSNRKGRKITEIIKSITRLTNEVERCSSNVVKYSNALHQSAKDTATNSKSPSNYAEWLGQMTESSFGQRFIKNLEAAQEQAIAIEVQRIKNDFNEKLRTTRKLIKFHYKQKTFEKFRATVLSSTAMQSHRDEFNELIDEKLRLLKEKEDFWKQNLERASTNVPPSNEKTQNPSIRVHIHNDRKSPTTVISSALPTNRKDQSTTESKKPIDIEIFNEPSRPIEPVIDNMVQIAKNRLQQLENEGEHLDKSFQRYLKKQNEEKRLLAADIDRAWQQYERAKHNMTKTFVVSQRRNVPTNIHFHENTIPVPVPITDEMMLPSIVNAGKSFENPYKILHQNLTKGGSLDLSIQKKEIATETNVIPTLMVERSDHNASADKVSQIPVPMNIKTVMKKTVENGSKNHLRVDTKGKNELSDASDVSSYMNLKNISPLNDVHLSDSKPSELSARSKHSDVSLNSPKSTHSGRLKLVGNELIMERASTAINQTFALGPEQRASDTKDISQLFKKIDIKNHSTHSSPSDISEKLIISTGQKSSSSDDFWK